MNHSGIGNCHFQGQRSLAFEGMPFHHHHMSALHMWQTLPVLASCCSF